MAEVILYPYVGPESIREAVADAPEGQVIREVQELEAWCQGQSTDAEGWIAATFVIDASGHLRLAPRRSEHVACAGGGMVRAAGEIFIEPQPHRMPVVVEISNQSTGYCPPPESWPQVARALDAIPVEHPGRFTRPFVFRRCPSCGQRNVVKEAWFECAVCGASLPEEWNFG